LFLTSFIYGQDLLMQDGTFNQCNGVFFDSGGPASYSNNENYTITICSDSGDDTAIQLDFTFFDTQANADILTIYDGPDTDGALIGSYSGTNSPGVVQSTNSSGCLTISFQSNNAITREGFEAIISCATPCQEIDLSIITDPLPGVGGSVIIDQGSSIDFTADANFSVDGTGADYSWNFGDGNFSSGLNVTNTFNTIGTFTVTLIVTDTNPTGCSEIVTIVVQVLGPYLLIDQSTYSVEELVEDVLINSSCAEVSNIIFSTGTDFNSTNGIGYFSGNGVSFPFTEGILLTTGNASDASGPESGTLSSGDNTWPGDQDLADAIPDLDFSESFNATYIQFDFVPLANTIGFNFVFASEEYGTFQCQYTDAFAFLLTNNDTGATSNLALVPGSNDPISVLSVRDNTHNSSCPSSNEEFFAAYYGATGLPEIDSPIDYRGHTVSMFAGASVTPNTSYSIKLVISDALDSSYDAAVFLEAGSFDLGGNLGEDVTVEAGNALCLGDTITLDSQLEGADHIWYFNGEIIEGESNSIIEISEAGTYSVDIVFGEECATSDSILVEYKPTPIIDSVSDLVLCNAGNPLFDLTENDSLILGSQDSTEFNISYHNSEDDAENDIDPIISNLSSYSVDGDTEIIYVRIEDAVTQSCFTTGSFELILADAPPISNVSDLLLCDDITNDGIEVFNLELQTADILGDLSPQSYDVTYYITFDDANQELNQLNLLHETSSNLEPIFVRITSIDDPSCFNLSINPIFNLIVTNQASATDPGDLTLCDEVNPGDFVEEFDLEVQTPLILGTQDPATFTVTYHLTQEDADTGDSPLASLYTSTSQTIFVRVEEAGIPACYATTEFDLIVDPIPLTTVLTPLEECDDDADGLTVFTLTDKDTEALNGQTGLSVSYYLTQSDAEAGTPEIGPVYTNVTADAQQVWIRLTDTATDCFNTMPLDLVVNPLPVPEPASIDPLCDDDTDGLQTFDLSGVASQVIGSQLDMDVTYHQTQSDADSDVNALGDNITTTTPNLQTIFIRLENTITGCYAVSTIDLVVDPLPVIANIAPYVLCDDINSGDLEEEFDLSILDVEIINGQDATLSYHATEADAQNNIAPLTTLYSSPTQTIYAALQDNITGCRSVAPIELVVIQLPSTTVLTPLEECDDDADGLTVFTLTDKDTEALNGQTGLSVSYYLTQSDAEAGTPEIGPVYINVTADAQQVWIRLTDTATDCFNTMPLDLVVNPLPVPEPASIDPLCDDDTDGLQTFDLSGVASQVIGSQLDMDVTYHQTQSDADSDVNALGDNITTTTPNLQTIFIRLENTVTGCYAVSIIDLVVNSLPVVDLEDNYVICESASGGGLDFAIVDPGLSPANYSFIWRDESGTLISTDPTYTAEDPGIYSLEVSYTDGSGCTAPLEIFTVNESGNPAVTASVTSEPFADTHVIVATASGTGIYEFSLDQGPWQDSGTFIGVSAGEHSVNVRDVNGCGVTTYILFVIDFPPYFTPNGDGYNDVWNISALSGQMASKIYIFDRYGKLLKQISPAGDGWDGTYNGQMMPTSDYWFLLEYNDFNTGEPKQLRAHFTLKR
jgi:gliding motility-associated-like protein